MKKLNKNYSLPKLQEVSLDISSIQSKFFVWKPKKTSLSAGYIVFRGSYQRGSQGKGDATFIDWKINEFCTLPFPENISGLIIDLRQLDYSFGDDLEVYPGRLIRLGLPYKIVVSKDQLGNYEGILEKEKLTISIEEAFIYVKDYLQNFSF